MEGFLTFRCVGRMASTSAWFASRAYRRVLAPTPACSLSHDGSNATANCAPWGVFAQTSYYGRKMRPVPRSAAVPPLVAPSAMPRSTATTTAQHRSRWIVEAEQADVGESPPPTRRIVEGSGST